MYDKIRRILFKALIFVGIVVILYAAYQSDIRDRLDFLPFLNESNTIKIGLNNRFGGCFFANSESKLSLYGDNSLPLLIIL